jgi:Tol biopolymer transport system component
LFTVAADGSNQRQLLPWDLGAGGPAEWSPAADRIVFRAVQDEESGVGNFSTVRPDGSALTQVTHFTRTVISHKVGFSPDGEQIVYSAREGGGQNQLYRTRLDGSDERRVTTSPFADSSPDWAPA